MRAERSRRCLGRLSERSRTSLGRLSEVSRTRLGERARTRKANSGSLSMPRSAFGTGFSRKVSRTSRSTHGWPSASASSLSQQSWKTCGARRGAKRGRGRGGPASPAMAVRGGVREGGAAEAASGAAGCKAAASREAVGGPACQSRRCTDRRRGRRAAPRTAPPRARTRSRRARSEVVGCAGHVIGDGRGSGPPQARKHSGDGGVQAALREPRQQADGADERSGALP
jgi:hypothetical protein